MDSHPQEFGSLGVFGVIRESFKVLSSYTKLFLGLTLTLIAPLCIVGLGRNLIIEPIVGRIQWDEFLFQHLPTESRHKQEVDQDIHNQFVKLLIVFAVYIVILIAFSLLSTSAIVYSVACVYSSRVTSYKRVLSVVPRVWKRLVATLACAMVMMFAYGFLFGMCFTVVAIVIGLVFQGSVVVMAVVSWLGVVLFLGGFMYLSCVWHLGSVITVLEDSYGFAAIGKGLSLIKGKTMMAFSLFVMYFVLAFMVGFGFGVCVVRGQSVGLGTGSRVVIGITLIGVLSFVNLLGFLVQTIFYFACKAYHNEKIDRLELSEHLGAYLGEYVPLRSSIQLEALEP